MTRYPSRRELSMPLPRDGLEALSAREREFLGLAGLTRYGRPAIHEAAKSGEVFKIRLANARARERLGWEPRLGLDEGLALTVEAFRSERD